MPLTDENYGVIPERWKSYQFCRGAKVVKRSQGLLQSRNSSADLHPRVGKQQKQVSNPGCSSEINAELRGQEAFPKFQYLLLQAKWAKGSVPRCPLVPSESSGLPEDKLPHLPDSISAASQQFPVARRLFLNISSVTQ